MLQAEFDPASGRLSFFDPDIADTRITSGTAWISYRLADSSQNTTPLTGLGVEFQQEPITDSHGGGVQRIYKCQPNPDGIELTYRIKSYPQRPFLLLMLEVHNCGTLPINLLNLCLYQAGPGNLGTVALDGLPETHRFFKVGWHGWDFTGVLQPADRNRTHWLDGLTSRSYSNPATPKPGGRGQFVSEGWGIISGSRTAIVTGFASMDRQFGQVYADLRPGRESLMLLTQLDGIRLDPGEKCCSEWGYLQYVTLPNSQPDAEFIEAVAHEMQARVPASPPAPMWTHWYQFYQHIDESTFLRNVDQLNEQHQIVPYEVVELDDGYQSAWGDWTITNAGFPHGLAWLAGEVRKRGLLPGLWLAPFAAQGGSSLLRQHPDWLVRDQKGRPARVGFQYNFTTHALDLTHPQVLDHLRSLAQTLTRAFGFAMLKLDFINAAALPGIRYDPKLTRAQALRQGLQAIRDGAGEETTLLGCGCPFGPAIGVVDAMRIGPDTAPSWWPFFHWMTWAGPLIRANPSMPALRNAIHNTLALSSLNRRWWWNDPDCLLLRDEDTTLTEPEVLSQVTLAGVTGGMMVTSDDLQKVPASRLNWVSKLLPNLGLRGDSLDFLQSTVPRLYRVIIDHAGIGWQLVALFNWSDRPADFHLPLANLGYQLGARLHVFDFWRQQYWQVSEPELIFKGMPVHGCILIRLCQVGARPQLVGDTLHISQGLDLSSLRIADGSIQLETIDLGRRVKGELWLALDDVPKMVQCNGERVTFQEKTVGIFSIPLDFTGMAKVVIDL